jgi:hypothetical protein
VCRHGLSESGEREEAGELHVCRNEEVVLDARGYDWKIEAMSVVTFILNTRRCIGETCNERLASDEAILALNRRPNAAVAGSVQLSLAQSTGRRRRQECGEMEQVHETGGGRGWENVEPSGKLTTADAHAFTRGMVP